MDTISGRRRRRARSSSEHPNDHPFGIPEEHHYLLASLSLNSRSNSSISLTPSAKSSTSSNDSSSRGSRSISSMTPPRFRSRSKSPALPKILPSLPECVVAYDNLILGPLEHFLQFSDAIGQDVRRQAQMVKNLFEIQREFILTSTGHDISDRDHRHLTNPLGSGPAQAGKMREIKGFASRHSYSPNAAHLYFISDTIGTLGWVVSGDRPSHFVRESYDGGKHHVKNIPGMNPEKSLASVSALTDAQRDVHSGWVNTWQNVIIGLDGYVRGFHPRGLKWKKSE